MNTAYEIWLLRGLLKNTGHWYVDIQCPDTDSFIDLAEKAKNKANKRLSEMGYIEMWYWYRKWLKSGRCTPLEAFLLNFLDYLAWEMGRTALKGKDRDLYDECINLNVKIF